MIVVVDFDGTLALGDTSNISSMIPNKDLIDKINTMHNDGNYIKVVTARGSKSCNSLEERSSKYYDTLSLWLHKNGVNYDELSFVKEYGDLYLDDRCINIRDYLEYENLDSKFTTNLVRRVNRFVVKKTESSISEARWYKKAKELDFNIPEVLSYDVDTICTEFIRGNRSRNKKLIVDTLIKFKSTPPTNDAGFDSYVNRISEHLINNPSIQNGDKLLEKLRLISPTNTFNHGDFSTLNQLESGDLLYLIDPIYSENLFQSYVIDSAKYLFSILHYDKDFRYYDECYELFQDRLGITSLELNILVASECVRVSNRKKKFADIASNLIDVL